MTSSGVERWAVAIVLAAFVALLILDAIARAKARAAEARRQEVAALYQARLNALCTFMPKH